jgi:syntaxin-binding protein 1
MDKIAVMKETISALPQYQELKKLYAIHTKICADCMNAYQANNLEIISKIEQEMATGETAEGKIPKHLSDNVLSALENTDIAYYDRVRLLMLYLISQNGIRDDERQKFFDRGDFGVDISQALTNLSLMGVRLSASYDGSKSEPSPFSSRKVAVSDNQFENSRYVPPLKFLIEVFW